MDPRLAAVHAHASRLAKSSYQLSMKFYRAYTSTLRTEDNHRAAYLYGLAQDLQAAADALVLALEKTQQS